jgi:hypothetical protein
MGVGGRGQGAHGPCPFFSGNFNGMIFGSIYNNVLQNFNSTNGDADIWNLDIDATDQPYSLKFYTEPRAELPLQ